jgi:long-chain acyl-CoA synthetase
LHFPGFPAAAINAEMNLGRAFTSSATRHRTKPAVFWGERQYAYGELARQTRRLALYLQEEWAVRPGDRVALWLGNCPEFIIALFAILEAGGVAVPINNFLKPGEVLYILNDAGINAIISEAGREAELARLRELRPSLRSGKAEELGALSPDKVVCRPLQGTARKESDLAILIYTSGTTGHPKGAMLSHGNLLANVRSCQEVLAAVAADRFVVLLPMFHSFMLCVGVLLPLLVGGSIVLVKSLHPPKNIFAELIHHQGSILPAVPQFFRTMLSASFPAPLPLRVCISGGAPLPVEILREFNAKMPIPLIEGYGLSEASPVVSLNPLAGPWKEGSIGLPIPGVEVSVQSEAGKILSQGEIGEICVRGANVMLGYWNNPEETARTLRGGWLFTGDVGYQDADGYFFITDRKKDMLLVNGINVYPREIEEVLYQFPGVKEAAVIGVPDPRKGEQPLAFVAPQEASDLQEKAIVHFLRTKLADYKVPRRVLFLPNLPRNSTGKILKTALRQQI